jgi:hypothetical protein
MPRSPDAERVRPVPIMPEGHQRTQEQVQGHAGQMLLVRQEARRVHHTVRKPDVPVMHTKEARVTIQAQINKGEHMQVMKRKLKFKKGEATAEVMIGGCWHLGSGATDMEGVANFMEMTKRKAWWHTGDLVEAITPGDKRFQHGEHKQVLLDSIRNAKAILTEGRNSCWGTLMGNHEWAASGQIGDIAEDIALGAKVPYLGALSFFDIECPKGSSIAFTAHGKGSIGYNGPIPERNDVNRRIKLRQILDPFGGDDVFLKVVAHYHRTIMDSATMVYKGTVEDGEFKRRAVDHHHDWVAACPSLYKNFGDDGRVGYAEVALYPPTDLGWLGVLYNREAKPVCLREYSPKGNITREVEAKVLR